MPRKKADPRNKCRLTREELEDRLEEELPGITDCIPSASKFKFFKDQTTRKNLYVQVGATKVEGTKVKHGRVPVYVGLGDVTGRRMISFNVSTLHPEGIIHENKELSRIGTTYLTPFDCLVPLRYEYPGSSFAESLQWITELRALTMFAFVWCGRRDEFFNFHRGEGLRVLVKVLSRHLEPDSAAGKEDSDSGIHESAEPERPRPCVITDTDTGLGLDTDKEKDQEVDAENTIDGEGHKGATASMALTASAPRTELCSSALEKTSSKKRKHEEFVVGQEI